MTRHAQSERSTPLAENYYKRVRGLFHFGYSRKIWSSRVCLLLVLCFVSVGLSSQAQSQTVTLQTDGGMIISGSSPSYSGSLGAVNGLGIGNAAPLTAVAVSGGEFYYTPYYIVVSSATNGHKVEVKAYASPHFTTPSSAIQLMTCAYPGTCSSYSNYTNMPLTQGGEIDVYPVSPNNGNFAAYLGLFVSNSNGTSLTSPDSATINFDVYVKGSLSVTLTLQLGVSPQSAVQMQLATATGLTITPTGGSPDYTTNFGNVNGLGIGPGPGLTVVNGQVSNGSLYATPYLIEPVFSGFPTTSGTKITVYSSGFAHSAILTLYDSGSSGTGYGLISTSSTSPTQLTGITVSSGVNITRYLGLFVSNANGTGSFSDSATLTYTITVQ